MTLLHDPEVLAIDELSLGLAPLVVQELLGVIERLKAEGMTIILVEQSLNVALSVADRAVFLEKGQVRFRVPPPSSPNATTSRARCSSGRKAADRGASVATWVTSQLVFNGLISGSDDRSPGHGDRVDLPVDAGHQLRGRQHGPGRREPPRAPRHRVRHPVLARRDRLPDRRHAVRRGDGAGRHPPALLRTACDRARLDHRDLRSRARDRHGVSGDHRLRRAVPARRRPHVERRRRVCGITGAQLAVLVVVPFVAARARLVPQPHAASGARSRRRPRTPTSPGCRASTRRWCPPRCGRSPGSWPRSR